MKHDRTSWAYRATERRLYGYPAICERIKKDKEQLAELELHGLRGHSRDILRFKEKNNNRVDPEEIKDKLIEELKELIASNEREAAEIEWALDHVKEDPYFHIFDRYLFGLTDDQIADKIYCERTTVWRNRRRLLLTLVVLLYGAEAYPEDDQRGNRKHSSETSML